MPNAEGGNFNFKEVVELLCEKSNRLKSIVKHNMCRKIVKKLLHIIQKESSYSFCAYYSVGQNEISCCGNYQTQSPIATQASKAFSRQSSRKITRELNKESLLNQSYLYTKHAWSMLPIIKPALLSMLQSHVHLIPYSRPSCSIYVP